MSPKGEASTSARVADVLKSGLERHLYTSEDAAPIAGHGSHVVSNKFEPGAPGDMQLDVNWDEERFQKFVQRLSEPPDADAL